MTTPTEIIPYGFCHCGCGKKTKIADRNHTKRKWVKGQPLEYANSHRLRYLPTGAYTESRLPSRTYSAWYEMKKRCFNQRSKSFRHYGGRGITVCERWRESFVAFREDMGECPPGLELDRIDNDQNYEIGNCRWATRKEQVNNRRCSVFVTLYGQRFTITQLAEFVGMKEGTLRRRIVVAGMSVPDAVKVPIRKWGR